MSSVTDIILVTGIDDGAIRDAAQPNADKLNAWLNEFMVCPVNGGALVKVDRLARGDKAMQCDVFITAINYLDHEEFLAAFHAIQWASPECVQLMMKGEHDDLFTVYRPTPLQ